MLVVGIAASGSNTYVIGDGRCEKDGILTAAITNNPGAPIASIAEYPYEINVGLIFNGSTRYESGTSQNSFLNMISTALMIKIGG